MLKKNYIKKRNMCEVSFELSKEQLPAGVEADTVSVAGEFNGWDPAADPLKKVKGVWKLRKDLEPDQEIQFRYVINGTIWINDPEADKYVPNDTGEENSVVVTTSAE
jgi:1,4-alpha-glucan branching enzyme